MKIFGGNLEKWYAGQKLDNMIDKNFTYKGTLAPAKL